MTGWTRRRGVAVVCVLAITAAACGDDDSATTTTTVAAAPATTAPEDTVPDTVDDTVEDTTAPETSAPPDDAVDPVALGLWDDGPCDASLPSVKVGLTATFQSPVISLGDQALGLEAAAVAFNARGGANGHCVEVILCDEGADPNKAVDCVRSFDRAGIVATINDTNSFATADVVAAFEDVGIPRFAVSPSPDDYSSSNSFPFEAGGGGTSFMMPVPFVRQGLQKVAIIRVDTPQATSLLGLYQAIYGEDDIDFIADIPVPPGTTDFSQFILAAEAADAEAIVMPIGGAEGVQVLRAARQLDADVTFSVSLSSFATSDLASLGEYSSRVILNASIPPAIYDDPVIDLLTADLAASGEPDLQRENLSSSPMRSWVGLYAFLYMLREQPVTDFTRDSVRAAIEASGPIPMLGLTDDWTPSKEYPGIFPRTGTGYYAYWSWDDANRTYVRVAEANFHQTICGTPFGGEC